MPLQTKAGASYAKPFGFTSRSGARLQTEPPVEPGSTDQTALDVPSPSQVKLSMDIYDDMMAAAGPFAQPVIITGKKQGALSTHSYATVFVAVSWALSG